MDDIIEYLRPEMEKMLGGNDGGILFCWSVRVNYNGPWVRDVEQDGDEQEVGLNDDQDDEHDAMSVYLHSSKIQVRNGGKLARKMQEANQVILQRNIGPIRGETNLLIESVGDGCFNVINNANKIQ